MATNDGEEETVQKLIEKLLDEEEKTQQVIKQLQDEIKKMKREAEEIELIEETKHRDEIEKMKHEAQDVQQIQEAIYQYKMKKFDRKNDVLDRELEIKKAFISFEVILFKQIILKNYKFNIIFYDKF
ncbi:unnamed protein product [Rotaria sp. Silwood1]|nr:unnamed protein product [Rotaria sp. Silwood1]